MAQQTINVGTSPNDGTGTPLRTAFQYTNSNFSELYTAVGPSGNNIVVPGTATITGDLTVDTSTLKVDSGANKVGVGTTTMNGVLTVKNTSVLSDIPIYTIQGATNTAQLASWTINQNTDVISFGTDYGGALSLKTNSTERYAISSSGVATWSNVGGVAGTAMTLNATGLGVGIAPDATKSTRLSVYQTGDLIDEIAPLSVGNTAAGGMRLYAGVNNTNEYVYIGSVKSGTGYRSLILQPNGGNVGIGVTPSAWNWAGIKALELGYVGNGLLSWASSETYLLSNTYYNSGFKYGTAVGASYYRQLQGVHSWHTNSNSPSAGGSATFTQAMTLDASGNLLVGTTSGNNRVQVAGNIGLPNSCIGSFETRGVFSIDVANLFTLTGAVWRQCSFLLVYSGVDENLGNPTVLQTVVTLTGLSTYNTISKNDIVGTASVAVSNDTSSGARVTVTVPTGNFGSVYVMLLGGLGATTRPSMTINN